jgi:hypothetical protein
MCPFHHDDDRISPLAGVELWQNAAVRRPDRTVADIELGGN